MSEAQALVRLALGGDRIRRACEKLGAEQRALEGALRRAMPFLARRNIAVYSDSMRPSLRMEALESLNRPFHLTPLSVGAKGAAVGALVLDAMAISHGLDGMLGSGRSEVPALDPAGLTPAQAALASRIARGLVAAFDEVLAPMGAPISVLSEAPSKEADGSGLVVCTINIGEIDKPGAIVLLLPAAAIDTGASAEAAAEGPDPVTQAAIAEVELELIAELGRVRLPLSRLAKLCVGDVLRLPLSVDAPARIHVGGRVLCEGKPTTRGSQMAVEVIGHTN